MRGLSEGSEVSGVKSDGLVDVMAGQGAPNRTKQSERSF